MKDCTPGKRNCTATARNHKASTDAAPHVDTADKARWTTALLDWYATHRRELPWRATSDPYAVWISEIMLQQTRVAQGLDYFRRFMTRFPRVEMLAAAPEDEVLKLWQGLGYYSRARNLHAAARSIAGRGAFPTTYEEIRALRGVGDYTAAAIASIAFGLPHAVVDGNVYRVLSRYYGVATPIDTTAGQREFRLLAQALLDGQRPGLYNQALMDFGALQCTPKSPRCAECPLCDSCAALASGRVDTLPVKARRTAVTDRYLVYIYFRSGRDTFLRRRPAGDIWQGLYEPFLAEFDHAPQSAEIESLPSLQALPARPVLTEIARGVTHVLTHRRLHADFYLATLPPDAGPDGYLRVPEERLQDYAVPRLVEILLGRMHGLTPAAPPSSAS